MKKTNRKSGFTLVELMVVAAIIAILAAIIVPLLTTNRDRAIATDGQNLLGTMGNAMKVYFAKTGKTVSVPNIDADDPLLASELGKSKYFTKPTITSVSTAGNTFTFIIQTTLNGAHGSMSAGDALILNDTGVWSGQIATKVGL